MTNTIAKRLQIFIVAVISLGLLSAGCTQREQNTLDSTSSLSNSEESLGTISKSIEDLNSKNNHLTKKLDELKAEIERNSNQKESLTTENTLQEIKNKLALAEADRKRINALEAKVNTLSSSFNSLNTKNRDLTMKLNVLSKGAERNSSQLSGIKKIFQESEQQSTPKYKYTDEEESRKDLIKKTQENRKASLVEDLLDKAINLYRQEKYEDAIAKWNEAIALDPKRLEAKFNIEIAKDKINDKKIKDGLKALRTQKDR